MNRSRLVLVIVAAVATCSPLQAVAAPTAYYNPATGGIHLKNDTGEKLYGFGVASGVGGELTGMDTSIFASIPGAIFDPGDLPGGFLYFDFPDTGVAALGVFIGDVILPNTPPAAMFAAWLAYGAPTWQTGPVVVIPEPAAASAGIGCLATLAAARLRSRRIVRT